MDGFRTSIKRSFSTMDGRYRDPTEPRNDPHPQHLALPVPPRMRDWASPSASGPARRYPGDGFDYRRPMLTLPPREETPAVQPRGMDTVDLTADEFDIGRYVDTGAVTATRRTGHEGAASHAAQRLPRYDRNIIDIASSDDESELPENTADLPGHYNPQARRTTASIRRPGHIRQPTPAMELEDIEFVGARTRRDSPHNVFRPELTPPFAARRRSLTPYPGNNEPDTIDLTALDDDDDDVVMTRARTTNGGVNLDRPTAAGVGNGTREDGLFGGPGVAHLRNMLHQRIPDMPQAFWRHYDPNTAHQDLHHLHSEVANLERSRERRAARQAGLHVNAGRPAAAAMRARNIHVGQMVTMNGMPGMMDYGAPAFDMGLGGRPPTPPYQAPGPPPEGFTRSPAEDDVVVCPNCGDELLMGKNDEKQQLWVVKQCGHAYCGTCVANRTRSTKSRGKAKITNDSNALPLPFDKCLILDCTNKKRITKTDLIHVYINS